MGEIISGILCSVINLWLFKPLHLIQMPVKIVSIVNYYARKSTFTKILKYGLTKNILPIYICSSCVFINIQTYDYYVQISLRKKWPYLELLWSTFVPHCPAFGLNTERYSPYSFRMRENAEKIRTRITPNTDTFTQSFMQH